MLPLDDDIQTVDDQALFTACYRDSCFYSLRQCMRYREAFVSCGSVFH